MIVFSGNISKNFTQKEYHSGSTTVYMYTSTTTFIRCLQTFRNWLDKPMYVNSWYRTKAENQKCGGIATSNHLTGTAVDWHLNGQIITKDLFIKYATKWAEICKELHCVGEAGLYTWGVHFGMQNPSQAKYNKHKFVHWDSRSGKQIDNPFSSLVGL